VGVAAPRKGARATTAVLEAVGPTAPHAITLRAARVGSGGDQRPLVVVALGGNALLRRGEPLDAGSQQKAARAAAQVIASIAPRCRLIVTHGNGPQVGLLALWTEAYSRADGAAPYPLDVLGAESSGQIGYVIELELDNAIEGRATVAIITRTLVSADDPAFSDPTKFIGPIYEEADAKRLAAERGWVVKPDGTQWRRVVPSPEPRAIVQLDAVRDLVEAGFTVVCTGGGGVPVVRDAEGREHGIEAVIDKDLASSLLATDLGADILILATDVDGAYEGWGTPEKRRIASATPARLRELSFPAGSMGPKVEAVCRFVERTGGRAAIGQLEQIVGLLEGTAGTQVVGEAPGL
jgi:carbamate kinase